jgi:hypothetical protein
MTHSDDVAMVVDKNTFRHSVTNNHFIWFIALFSEQKHSTNNILAVRRVSYVYSTSDAR